MNDRTETRNADSVFSSLIEHAIEVSAQWHDRTYRKGRWRNPAFSVPEDEHLSVPVIAHVTAVAFTLQRAEWTDETVAAGLLHDVLEDRNYWGDHMSLENLQTLMGAQVAEFVAHVSERKYDEDGNRLGWRERKDDYITGLREAPAEAIAISLADKLHNLWSINESLERGVDVFEDGKYRKGLGAGPREQEWFFDEVIAISNRHDDPRLAWIRKDLNAELQRFRRLVAR